MQTHIKQVSFRLPAETLEALDQIKKRDGVPVSEQVRRALQLWIESKKLSKARGR